MISVGIDVAKDKHDCFIMSSDGEVIVDVFTIENNLNGFEYLYKNILSAVRHSDEVKVGLEATGHYSYNILGFLLDKGLTTYVLNPLLTSRYRNSQSCRKTKTDKIDARSIASMLISYVDLKPYTRQLYHTLELKSLTRYRFNKVSERSKLKMSISRLVTILFPELEKLFSSIHAKSSYAILSEFGSTKAIANANLTKLSNILSNASRGRFSKQKAIEVREAARTSIGTGTMAQVLELKQTILLIATLDNCIKEIENEINELMKKVDSKIDSIPGVGTISAAIIIAEVGNFDNFDSPSQILAFSGISPSIYQSGKYISSNAKMEKRGSKYLRYTLFNCAKTICLYDPVFAAYLDKKLKEGKHYFVAISHVVKKLIRVIFHLQKTGLEYVCQCQ